MEELYLKEIQETDKEKFLDFIKEFVVNGSTTDGMWYTGSILCYSSKRKINK